MKKSFLTALFVLSVFTSIPVAKVEAIDLKKLCKLYSQITTREKVVMVVLASYFIHKVITIINAIPNIPQQHNQISLEKGNKQLQDQIDGFCDEQTHNELKDNRSIYCNKCHSIL